MRRVHRGVALLGLAVILAGGALWLRRSAGHDDPPHNLSSAPPIPEGTHGSYITNFPAAENPISEGGKWISGKAAGIDWSDVATVPGLAYGKEPGTSRNAYDDATALLAGTWGSDQTVEATVHTVDQNDEIFEEVELRLRSSLSAHLSTGYEVLFRCSKTPKAYASIVRWNGRLGKYTYLSQQYGSKYGVADGDVIRASVTGQVISAYINGLQVMQATDSTYINGNPGMGFWLSKGKSVSLDYGFSRFVASDVIHSQMQPIPLVKPSDASSSPKGLPAKDHR